MTAWPVLKPGTELRIVKHSPSGEVAAEYPGWIVDEAVPSSWIMARAVWTHRLVELDGLTFAPGDRLHEFFSPEHHFNVFSVWSPEGELRGWYANVTLPATLDINERPPVLAWYDRYVDLIALPDGTAHLVDEDELADSGLERKNPEEFAVVVRTSCELQRLFAGREFPFHECGGTERDDRGAAVLS